VNTTMSLHVSQRRKVSRLADCHFLQTVDYLTNYHEAEFQYLGTTAINFIISFIPEKIQSRLNSGNACYHSVPNFSSPLLSKNVNIRI
jgi:hypothetical protein